MRIAEVIGRVTLAKSHSLVAGATWLVAVPLSREGLKDNKKGRDEEFVVFPNPDVRVGLRAGMMVVRIG